MADCGVHYARNTRFAWAKWRKKMHWQSKVHSLETCKRGKICTTHAWCLQGGCIGLWSKKSLPAWRLPRGWDTAKTPGGYSGLKPGLLGLEIHSPLQFFRRWQHLSTSLNLEVSKIPFLSYWWCADFALDWDRTSGKASLAHALDIHAAASPFAPSLLCHYWRQCYFC